MRIGELAERSGLTTRTIRYYEERGLLGHSAEREKGAHRVYTEADVVRLNELIRLRDLLGLSLAELVALAEAEEARAALRGQWADSSTDAERGAIVDAAIPHVERQLALVAGRQERLAAFREELDAKLKSLKARRRELATRTT